MERHRGHFYNWYDTRSLKPLPPRYVSTVDSGNLVGHLLVLRSGLLELIETPLSTARAFDGLRDTVETLLDVARGARRKPDASARSPGAAALLSGVQRLDDLLEQPPRGLTNAARLLSQLTEAATDLSAAHGTGDELAWWAAAFERSCRDHHDDLVRMAAWVELTAPAESPDLPQLSALVTALDDGLSLP